MRFLIVSHRKPDPNGKGDSKIAFQAASGLRRAGHDVVTVDANGTLSRKRGVSLVIAQLARGQPMQFAAIHRASLTRAVQVAWQSDHFDGIVAIHARAASAVPRNLTATSLALLVDTYGPAYRSYLPYLSPPLKAIYALEATLMDRFERSAARNFGAVGLVSLADVSRLTLSAGSRARVVHLHYGVASARFAHEARQGAGGEPLLMFTGQLAYRPNRHAAERLLRELWPVIHRASPRARLVIAGADPPRSLRRLAAMAPRAELLANPSEMGAVLKRATVALAPVLMGGGVQTKVLEAMATGVPVVCSPFANAGLHATPGRHLLIANTANDYARQATSLLDSPTLADKISREALTFVTDNHSLIRFESDLVALCESIVTRHARADTEEPRWRL